MGEIIFFSIFLCIAKIADLRQPDWFGMPVAKMTPVQRYVFMREGLMPVALTGASLVLFLEAVFSPSEALPGLVGFALTALLMKSSVVIARLYNDACADAPSQLSAIDAHLSGMVIFPLCPALSAVAF